MTKAQIIETAFRVWGRDFYKRTSLSQLAKELGVSKPALYRHFFCKNALTAAMTEHFCKDMADSIKDGFEQALRAEDPDEGLFIIIKSLAGYFGRNVYSFIFNLTNIYERKTDGRAIAARIKSHGADMRTIRLVMEKKYNANAVSLHLAMASLVFFMSNFHITYKSMENTPSNKDIDEIIHLIYNITKQGLGFSSKEVNSMDFDKLEKMVNEKMHSDPPEPLFKAVAEAVAQAGPWKASMEMVAKRMGLSKSSLYGHFKNKKDMLRRLFITEFERIIDFARQGIILSEDAAQQLYLGIYSIAVYLHSRPEILIAMDWIRTRKLDLGRHDKNQKLFRLFEDLNIEKIRNSSEEEKQRLSHWITFLLVNILMNSDIKNAHAPQKRETAPDIRLLYKYITLGFGGFVK